MRRPHGLPPVLAGLQRTVVFSVLNVTPDSFSDGGRYVDADVAIAHALEQVAAGADVIDVGGESTRPGAQRIGVDEELDRVLPVIRALTDAGVPTSIDTMRAEVARAAVAAGTAIINDVSGGLADPEMPAAVRDLAVPYIAMHWRGHSADMQELARYRDVVTDVRGELLDRVEVLLTAGVDPGLVVLDPGLGFAKTGEHNWELLRHLPSLAALGFPLLVGASRKRFLGDLLAGPDGPRPPILRDRATDAISALSAAQGVWGVRVHEAAGSRDAIAVAGEWPAPLGGLDPRTPRSGPGGRRRRGGDRIELTGVRGTGFHGVFDHERADGQEFVVDALLDVGSTREAAATDRLARTVHYGEVAEALHAIVTGPPVDLIETLAESLAQACLAFPGVQRVEIAVHKPSAPITVPFDDVVVRITRHRAAPTARRTQAALGLGANLGDPRAALSQAITALAAHPGIEVTGVSGLWATEPVGGPEQPEYRNAVVTVETDLSPAALHAVTGQVEQAAGRVRDVRWGPRTLDIDVLDVAGVRSADPVLTLPHPRAHQRAFVLVPWAQIAPDWVLTPAGAAARTVAAWAADVREAAGPEAVTLVEGGTWWS